MKVTGIKESIELCTEAGWSAYDLFLDSSMKSEDILRLKQLGYMTYLSGLKQPFYRIENQYYMIKGLEGECQLRVAMLIGKEAVLEQVRDLLQKTQ